MERERSVCMCVCVVCLFKRYKQQKQSQLVKKKSIAYKFLNLNKQIFECFFLYDTIIEKKTYCFFISTYINIIK